MQRVARINSKGDLIYENRRTFWQKIKMQRQLVIMSVPFMLMVFIFSYTPLIGWYMAFTDYKPGVTGILNAPFIGLAHFKELFTDSYFYTSLRNTLAISSLKLIFNFVSTISLAVMLNEVKNQVFKRTVQTISYLPHFVSWVVAANLIFTSLSPESGIVNTILLKLGIVKEPVPFMGMKEYFWWILALSNVWKEVGWGAIIYLSAMTGIDPDLYDAAAVDGAGRILRIFTVTLPSIAPTIKLLLVLNIGSILNAGFEQVFLMTNPSVDEVGRTLQIYVYNYAMKYFRFAYGTAIGIFNSVVSFTLINISNSISKKIDGEGIF